MKKKYGFLSILLALSFSLSAQMWNGKDTLYGNEWINYAQTYYKMKIAKDGIYKINYQDLKNAGIPLANVKGNQLKIYALGKEIPIYISNNNLFTNNDYVEFYAKKNRGELDAELFRTPLTHQMNPAYSMFNDTISYFLTWSNLPSNNFKEITNNLVNPPIKETHCMYQIDTTFHSFDLLNGGYDKYYEKIITSNLTLSSFDMAEGFASTYLNTRKIPFSLDGLIKNNKKAIVEGRLGFGKVFPAAATIPPSIHYWEVKYNGVLLKKDSLANEFNTRNFNIEINNTDLDNSSSIEINSKNGVPLDKHRIAYLRFTYPHSFNFSKKRVSFELDASNASKYLEVEKINVSNPVLYDLTNNLRLTPTVENGIIKAVIPPSLQTRKILIIDSPDFNKVVLEPVKFVDFKQNTGNYIILSNPVYYKDPKSNSKDWVKEYANYRSSIDGGSYKSIVVDIQQLYDQFSYGIDRHCMSLQNFSNFAAAKWSAKSLFIIGKGLEYRELRDPNYFANFSSFLTVPTYGFPGSDNLITATKWSPKQKLSVGRIPVLSPDDVRIYLKKVKEYELVQKNANSNIKDRLWSKNVVHLVGGYPEFLTSLNGMANVIINNKFGAQVSTFYKTSSDPVQSSNSEQVRKRIREGASIVNYYGHSSTSNLEYSLDGPSELENKGRYFYFLAHGCYSGQIHIPTKSLGPSYIFQEDGGAIGFSAPSSFGLTGMLDNYGSTFYSEIGGRSYGKTIGEAIKNTVNTLSTTIYNPAILHNMTYQGDPAIKLITAPTPDYTIDLASIQFQPEVITTLTNRFRLNYRAYNLGRADKDTISVSLIRQLPDGTKIVIKKDTIKGFSYQKELFFDINGAGEYSGGKNIFYLKIDADNRVSELPSDAELNNDVNDGKGIELNILTNDVNLLEPRNFSIINKASLTLKAIPSDVLSNSQKYIFELDTTANFNSSIKQRKEIVQSGGVMNWTPLINFKDSTVYYWRVSPDSTITSPFKWRNSSFIYLKNASEGWNQSHYFQFKDNNFTFIDLLNKDRRFNYQGNSTGVNIKNNDLNILRPSVGINELTSSFKYYAMLDGVNAGVMCWVFNDTTGLPWVSRIYPGTPAHKASIQGYTYDKIDYFFPYRTDNLNGRKDLIKFLDTIPSKSYVIFMTVQYNPAKYLPEKWAADSITIGKNIFSVLEKQGAKLVRNLEKTGSVPYFYFYRKDDPTYPRGEKIWNPNNPDATIGYIAEIKGFWYKGSVKSVNIGAASKWSAIHWRQSEVEAKDTAFLNVYAIKNDGKEDVIFSKTTKNIIDISTLDPVKYPNLRLEWYSRDSTKRTSPQLDYWRVLYDGVPEAVPNAVKLFKFQSDTLQQGQALEMSLAAENVSKYDMKDLLVKFNLKKSDNTQVNYYQKYKPLLNNDTVITRFRLETRDLEGKNTLTVQLNPNKNQVEQDTSNNFAYLNFVVEKDKRNPLVDVTFDGTRILNGDIVSPEPNIVIQMKDENRFLLLDDTSLFRIYLRSPDETKAQLINFDGVKMKFIPATSAKNNRATVELNPKFIKDGDYELLIKAKDATGNKVTDYQLTDKDKGNADFFNYRSSFKVITKSSISKILNYPNPFTTSTHFVYTLTGKEPPAYFKIQVMSVSGKVVRELTQDDLGELRTGTHQTDKSWDGTDQFGDKLANGVYLYKIIAKKANGENYESHETGADQFFKNDVGKMVILR